MELSLWVQLPHDIVIDFIYPKLDIDQRHGLGVKPNKLNINVSQKIERLLKKSLRFKPQVHYFSVFADKTLRSIETSWRVGNNVYIYRKHVLSRNRRICRDEIDYNDKIYEFWMKDIVTKQTHIS